jgi:hypothetical protein
LIFIGVVLNQWKTHNLASFDSGVSSNRLSVEIDEIDGCVEPEGWLASIDNLLITNQSEPLQSMRL